MNTLALIQKRLAAQSAVERYNRSIAYRGVVYTPTTEVKQSVAERCYTYRGRTYCK